MDLGKFFMLAFFTTVFGLTATAEAGQRQGAFSVSPSIGYHAFDSNQRLDDAAAFGLSLGYTLTNRWSIELDGRFTPTETDLKSGGGFNVDLDVWNYSLNALYHFKPEGPFVPYLTGGFGNSVYLADGYKDDEDFHL